MNIQLRYEWYDGGWWYRVLSHSSEELAEIFDIALSVHEGGVTTDKLQHVKGSPPWRMWVSPASKRALEEAGIVDKIYMRGDELPSHGQYPGHLQELLDQRPNSWSGMMDILFSGKLIWVEPLVPLDLTVTQHRALHGLQTLGQWLPTWSTRSDEYADIIALPDFDLFYKACGFLTNPTKTEAQNLSQALSEIADKPIPIKYVYRHVESGKIYQKICRHDRLFRIAEYYEGAISDEEWGDYKEASQISPDAGAYLIWRSPLLVPFSEKTCHRMPWLHFEDCRMVRRLEGGRMSSSDVNFPWWVWNLKDSAERINGGINRYELSTRKLILEILQSKRSADNPRDRSNAVRKLERVFQLYQVLGLISDYEIGSKESWFHINRGHQLYQQDVSNALRGKMWPVSGDVELIMNISAKDGIPEHFKPARSTELSQNPVKMKKQLIIKRPA